MDTTEDHKGSPAVDAPAVVHLPQSEIEKDLDTAMAIPDTGAPSVTAPVAKDAPPQPSQLKRKGGPRFGKNPDGTPAKKADKKEIERTSEWGKFLHGFKLAHPEISSLEATIEARKVYVPKSGKQKSFERIFTEVWKTQNPMWPKMDKEQRTLAIRRSFLDAI